MEKENTEDQQKFEEAVKEARKLNGGVTAFILVALAKNRIQGSHNSGVVASYGTCEELGKLYSEVPEKVRVAGAAAELIKSLMKNYEKEE